jgi:N-acetylglucosaminyldiphosphoundecaprenol N-acetyl-beta-D-mannosaminyltransferase
MVAEGLAYCQVLGVDVAAEPLDRCVERIVECLDRDGPPFTCMCANPHSLYIARHDPELMRALRSADLVVPDGLGVVAASRLLALRGAVSIPERVTGSAVFHAVSQELDRRGGKSCFFLGSSQDTLELIEQRMAADFPGIEVAGSLAPPFKERFDKADDRAMVEAVNAASPDVLWVGLTAPKQERWIARNRDRLRVRFVGAVGAVFDFYAGTVERPSPLLRRFGLEWAGRLWAEPGRLWRRTLVSGTGFVGSVFKEMVIPASDPRQRGSAG